MKTLRGYSPSKRGFTSEAEFKMLEDEQSNSKYYGTTCYAKSGIKVTIKTERYGKN